MESFVHEDFRKPWYSWSKLLNSFISRPVAFFEFLVFSSLYLSMAAAGMAWCSCTLQGIPCSVPIVLVLCLVVFSVYNLNRRTDQAEDALNHERRFSFTSRFERPLFLAALASYALAVGIALYSGSFIGCGIAMIPLFCGILYSVPIIPRGWGVRRLKEIPLVKNILVSFAWGATFALIPVALSGLAPGGASLLTFVFIFSWTFVASVLPDIRDMKGDALVGVVTIPVVLGISRSRVLLTVINLIAGAVILTLGIRTQPLASTGLLICSLAYSQGCILAIGHDHSADFLCDVISDGQFLVLGALFFVLTYAYMAFTGLAVLQ
ncbi:4-hydroxybenzoate polyprenyltransferase [Methanolinea mesophila]|uniref:UbiA family prenyltransferase n=1 Tax=Methanolinea mesophila TaxID=547055 RepID=UPI001AEA8ABC|nr:UbiA family prenyltransferase [Methanolinea mesophila]MBP1929817.1 4-hydroxybenzoate polyprenyltransferase [Methanolinea mesophila]